MAREADRSERRDNLTTSLFRLMGRNAIWTLVETVHVNWPTFHTQGMVKIGDTFYVSSVEVISSTVRNGTVTDALDDFSIDRSAGTGRGWLFKFNAAGQLLAQDRAHRRHEVPPGRHRLRRPATSGCQWPSIGRTAGATSTASIRETLAAELVFDRERSHRRRRAQPSSGDTHARRELGLAAPVYMES